jgi:hypothetical protein
MTQYTKKSYISRDVTFFEIKSYFKEKLGIHSDIASIPINISTEDIMRVPMEDSSSGGDTKSES